MEGDEARVYPNHHWNEDSVVYYRCPNDRSENSEDEEFPSGVQRFLLVDKWREIFDKFDVEGFGEIPWQEFEEVLKDPEFQAEVGEEKRELLLFKTQSQGFPRTTAITFQEFVNLMTGKRSRSFTCAVHDRDGEISSVENFHLISAPSLFRTMVRVISEEFLTDDRDRKYYADNYTCYPPPLFILFVTIVEVASFAYYYANGGEGVAIESIFIYRPDRKREIWRFFLYMLLHAGWLHVAFNVVVQILVGLPLEMVHGSLRIAAIYMAGVLAGSLGTSVMDPGVYLVGASGGVYALLAAHLANVLLNYHHMHCGVVRLLGVFAIASADVGFAVYNRYAGGGDGVGGAPPVSFVAHLAGALAGLTIGLIVLKNFGQNLHEKLIWWVGLGVYMACTLFAILYNVFSDTSSRAVFLDDIPKDNFVFVEPVPLGSLS